MQRYDNNIQFMWQFMRTQLIRLALWVGARWCFWRFYSNRKRIIDNFVQLNFNDDKCAVEPWGRVFNSSNEGIDAENIRIFIFELNNSLEYCKKNAQISMNLNEN